MVLSRKEKYQLQFRLTVLNKQKKLLKHCKNQPNDNQAKKVLEVVRGEN